MTTTRKGLVGSAIRSTESRGTTMTPSRRSTRRPSGQRSSRSAGLRSSMIRNRPRLLSTIATAMAAAAARIVSSLVPGSRASPTMPAPSPWRAAIPPSADWRRHTDSGRMICVDAPAATPTSGPPMSAARTMTGADAVYQLRGPSWTTTRSAAAAATTSATAIGTDVSSAAPARYDPEHRRHGRDDRDPDRDARTARRVGNAWSRTASNALAPSPPCRSWTCHPQLIKRERRPGRYPPFRGSCRRKHPLCAVSEL